MIITINNYQIEGTPSEMCELMFIMERLNRHDEEKVAPVEEPAEQAEEPAPAPKKRPFDIGKAKALREAGWTLNRIADELKCSPQTVSNKLKEVGAL